MRVLLAGASGVIGPALIQHISEEGHEVRLLLRATSDPSELRRAHSADAWQWNPQEQQIPQAATDWADAVVSLNGANLAKLPWTKNSKSQIASSRILSTQTIARAIARSATPPQVWVSASAVGIYGDRPGEELDEDSAPGTGFLAEVVQQWEFATLAAQQVCRTVHARTGLVLALDGVLKPLVTTTKIGLGAAFGSGQQHWPWVSLEDEVRAIWHLVANSSLAGPVNIVGPEPASQRGIGQSLAAELNRWRKLKIPATLLTATLGDAARDLLLADQRVTPTALLKDGFQFRHETAQAALRSQLR